MGRGVAHRVSVEAYFMSGEIPQPHSPEAQETGSFDSQLE
jgi:hypothetical protein